LRAFILFAIGLVLSGSVAANSNTRLEGYVFDDRSGAGIADALIEAEGTAFGSLSDNSGYFALKNIPPGRYGIKITAEGYYPGRVEISVLRDITKDLHVRLSPRIYQLDGIKVTARRGQTESDRITIISKSEIREGRIRNVAQLLETVEGLYVQKSGIGGKAQLRIRGSDPKQVLILIDGQKVNPSGSGVADLSTIPVDIVEKIEIYRGGASAEFGPDALAGAVNIITRPERIFRDMGVRAGKYRGKWNYDDENVQMITILGDSRFSGKFSFDRKKSDGDFNFSYTAQGPGDYDTVHTGRRTNNDTESLSLFTSGIFRLGSETSLGYSAQYYDSKYGLPGQATRQNEYGRAGDERILMNSALEALPSPDHRYKVEVAYSRFSQAFMDTMSEPAGSRFDSHYRNDIFTVRHRQSHSLLKGDLTHIGVEYRLDRLDHTDGLRPAFSMGVSSRKNYSVYVSEEHLFDLVSFPIAPQVTLDGAVRYDFSRTDKDSTSWQDTTGSSASDFVSPKLGMAVSFGRADIVTLRANYGKSFRLPSINALFWKGDVRSGGNPGLKPEKSEHSEAGAEFKIGFRGFAAAAGLTYFHSHTTDLIIWQPDYQGVWQPRNLASGETSGHEEFVEFRLKNRLLTVRYQNTITTARNKTPGHNTYNKRLPFYPHFITSLAAGFDCWIFSGRYEIRWVDMSYTNQANTRYYDGYRIDDIRLSADIAVGRNWTVSFDGAVNDLHDTAYVLMAGQPMPGREWQVGIEVGYGISDNR
jgi:outer membrane cobalamin receptor